MSILSLAHVNLTVPSGTLAQANEFYGTTLGLTARPVPALQRDSLAWFDIGDSGQQVHIAFGDGRELRDNLPDAEGDGGAGGASSKWAGTRRHPCFRLASGEELVKVSWLFCLVCLCSSSCYLGGCSIVVVVFL